PRPSPLAGGFSWTGTSAWVFHAWWPVVHWLGQVPRSLGSFHSCQPSGRLSKYLRCSWILAASDRHPPLHNVEVIQRETGQRHMLQRDGCRGIHGDDGVATGCCCG